MKKATNKKVTNKKATLLEKALKRKIAAKESKLVQIVKYIDEHPIEKIPLTSLKTLSFNRKVIMRQVDVLLNSLYNCGILRLPIVAKLKLDTNREAYYIIDGQHLVSALHKANVKETTCFVIEDANVPRLVYMMAKLNNTNLKWVIDDYVNAYSALCNKEYDTLRTHKLSTGLSYSICGLILGNSEQRDVKNGTFKADTKDADVLTSNLIDVVSYLGTSNSKFMKSYIKFRRSPNIDYVHTKFMQRLALNKSKIQLVHDEQFMKSMLEEIYK